MNDLESVRSKIGDLRREERRLINEATAEVKERIEILKKQEEALELSHRLNCEAVFYEMAEIIAEISKISFLTKIRANYDNKFKVTHHVRWLEIRDIDSADEYESICYSYEDDATKAPFLDNVKEVLSLVKEQYMQLTGDSAPTPPRKGDGT